MTQLFMEILGARWGGTPLSSQCLEAEEEGARFEASLSKVRKGVVAPAQRTTW